MSTSPETTGTTEDRLIAVISKWLGRHMGNDELRRQISANGTEGLTPTQIEAIEELARELDQVGPGQRGHVEMVARETVEVLALGE
jgi:DNA-binding IclR family transcriptional regulator